jgi:hypothetical protein
MITGGSLHEGGNERLDEPEFKRLLNRLDGAPVTVWTTNQSGP